MRRCFGEIKPVFNIRFDAVLRYEAVILLLLYVIYILLMVFNVKIEGFVRRICCCQTEETTFLVRCLSSYHIFWDLLQVQGSIEVIDEDIEGDKNFPIFKRCQILSLFRNLRMISSSYNFTPGT